MLCARCRRAEAVVDNSRLTGGADAADSGDAVVEATRLCATCARQEEVAAVGEPPQVRLAGVERFHPLHAHALRLLAHLEATYYVTRSEVLPTHPGRLSSLLPPARPPVLLTPWLPEAAPLAVMFTEAPGSAAPGLVVRCGRWHEAAIGITSGGAHHPRATLAGEVDALEDLVGRVVDGLFAEEVRRPIAGSARLVALFGDGTPREGLNGEGGMLIPRARAQALIGAGSRAVRWRPWPRRRLWFSADLRTAGSGTPA